MLGGERKKQANTKMVRYEKLGGGLMACAGFFIYESKPLTIQLKPEGVLNDVAVAIVTIEQPGQRIFDNYGVIGEGT